MFDPPEGAFKVWALLGIMQYCISLTVPRVFYFDSLLEPADERLGIFGSSIQRVKRHLPKGAEAHYLYRVRLERPASLQPSLHRNQRQSCSYLLMPIQRNGAYLLST